MTKFPCLFVFLAILLLALGVNAVGRQCGYTQALATANFGSNLPMVASGSYQSTSSAPFQPATILNNQLITVPAHVVVAKPFSNWPEISRQSIVDQIAVLNNDFRAAKFRFVLKSITTFVHKNYTGISFENVDYLRQRFHRNRTLLDTSTLYIYTGPLAENVYGWSSSPFGVLPSIHDGKLF
jgi:hypothetical protein